MNVAHLIFPSGNDFPVDETKTRVLQKSNRFAEECLWTLQIEQEGKTLL